MLLDLIGRSKPRCSWAWLVLVAACSPSPVFGEGVGGAGGGEPSSSSLAGPTSSTADATSTSASGSTGEGGNGSGGDATSSVSVGGAGGAGGDGGATTTASSSATSTTGGGSTCALSAFSTDFSGGSVPRFLETTPDSSGSASLTFEMLRLRPTVDGDSLDQVRVSTQGQPQKGLGIGCFVEVQVQSFSVQGAYVALALHSGDFSLAIVVTEGLVQLYEDVTEVASLPGNFSGPATLRFYRELDGICAERVQLDEPDLIDCVPAPAWIDEADILLVASENGLQSDAFGTFDNLAAGTFP